MVGTGPIGARRARRRDGGAVAGEGTAVAVAAGASATGVRPGPRLMTASPTATPMVTVATTATAPMRTLRARLAFTAHPRPDRGVGVAGARDSVRGTASGAGRSPARGRVRLRRRDGHIRPDRLGGRDQVRRRFARAARVFRGPEEGAREVSRVLAHRRIPLDERVGEPEEPERAEHDRGLDQRRHVLREGIGDDAADRRPGDDLAGAHEDRPVREDPEEDEAAGGEEALRRPRPRDQQEGQRNDEPRAHPDDPEPERERPGEDGPIRVREAGDDPVHAPQDLPGDDEPRNDQRDRHEETDRRDRQRQRPLVVRQPERWTR